MYAVINIMVFVRSSILLLFFAAGCQVAPGREPDVLFRISKRVWFSNVDRLDTYAVIDVHRDRTCTWSVTPPASWHDGVRRGSFSLGQGHYRDLELALASGVFSQDASDVFSQDEGIPTFVIHMNNHRAKIPPVVVAVLNAFRISNWESHDRWLASSAEAIEMELKALLPQLYSPDSGSRATVIEQLTKILCLDPKTTRKWLLAQINTETGEARKCLQSVLEALPPLHVRLEVEGVVTVGEQANLKVWLKNTSDESLVVVLPLVGSDVAQSFPIYHATIVLPNGEEGSLPEYASTGFGSIDKRHLVELKAGEEIAPFARAGRPHYALSNWRPEKVGVYTLHLTCDFGSKDSPWKVHWPSVIARGEEYREIQELFALVPRVRVIAELKVEVQ